jgi:hypothetical protein
MDKLIHRVLIVASLLFTGCHDSIAPVIIDRPVTAIRVESRVGVTGPIGIRGPTGVRGTFIQRMIWTLISWVKR